VSGFNGDAWLQFHRGRRLDTIPAASPDEPRYLCPDCPLLMNRQWYVDIFGREPGGYRIRYGYRDPSDDPTFLEDHRSIR
jgi:hypothetical protein